MKVYAVWAGFDYEGADLILLTADEGAAKRKVSELEKAREIEDKTGRGWDCIYYSTEILEDFVPT